ncbi:hypothetical protein ACJJTC_019006 [Scirpophaga incertulas]
MSTILLVLASALAVAVQAVNPSQCTTASFGITQGLLVPLGYVTLKAGVLEWDISLPSDVCPNSLALVGMKLTVCNLNGLPRPELHFMWLRRAILKRYTSTEHAATLYAWGYCDDLLNKSKSASVQFSSPRKSIPSGAVVRAVPHHLHSN